MSGIQEQYTVAALVYVHKDDHRNGSTVKSQWIISKERERDIFSLAMSSAWKDGDQKAWGLFMHGTTVSEIGYAVDRSRILYLAKFVGAEQPAMWHGYPADHQANNADIPCNSILKAWMSENVIPKAAISRIVKGKSWTP